MRRTLATQVIDAKGDPKEALQRVFPSLREAKLVFAYKKTLYSGCRMRVWKSTQTPCQDEPWKTLR